VALIVLAKIWLPIVTELGAAVDSDGEAFDTVKISCCVPVPSAFVALTQTVYVPTGLVLPLLIGVPDKRPFVDSVTPLGNADAVHAPAPYDASVNAGGGNPLEVTWKLPAVPAMKVVLVLLVM
jgi:hypothetical protein